MTAREQILGRIREALRVPAPFPGKGHSPTSHTADHPSKDGTVMGRNDRSGPVIPLRPSVAAQPWLPPGGDTPQEQWNRFCEASIELKTLVRGFETEADAHDHLIGMARQENWSRVASHRGELTDAAVTALGLPALFTDGGYNIDELEACPVGITECDALVAQTGSVLVTSRSTGGRALSILPPHHVVLARRRQLMPDLGAALEQTRMRYAPDWPSMISFITGPSRTGDIERILVLGAHGPRQLTVLVYE